MTSRQYQLRTARVRRRHLRSLRFPPPGDRLAPRGRRTAPPDQSRLAAPGGGHGCPYPVAEGGGVGCPAPETEREAAVSMTTPTAATAVRMLRCIVVRREIVPRSALLPIRIPLPSPVSRGTAFRQLDHRLARVTKQSTVRRDIGHVRPSRAASADRSAVQQRPEAAISCGCTMSTLASSRWASGSSTPWSASWSAWPVAAINCVRICNGLTRRTVRPLT